MTKEDFEGIEPGDIISLFSWSASNIERIDKGTFQKITSHEYIGPTKKHYIPPLLVFKEKEYPHGIPFFNSDKIVIHTGKLVGKIIYCHQTPELEGKE